MLPVQFANAIECNAKFRTVFKSMRQTDYVNDVDDDNDDQGTSLAAH